MVVSNKTYVVDTMIMLILFTFICIGTIFATSDRFVDSPVSYTHLNYKKNYTLFVPHDVPELIRFLGGTDSLAVFMDELFDKDIYYVGCLLYTSRCV